MTTERAEFLKTFDGVELYFRCFAPSQKQELKGLILAVHGFAEHSGRYAEVAEEVCKKGMAFAIFDIRGHGKSGPSRGDAQNLHSLVLDVLYVTNHAKSLLGLAGRNDLFFGLFGHSFGGLLVTYAASILRDSCPPIFLSSPLYRIAQPVPAWKKFVANSLPKFIPQLPVPVGIPPENISENPENNAAYLADELNLFSISARFGEFFFEGLNEKNISYTASLIKTPVTVCYGVKDKLVDPKASVQVFPLFSSPFCRLIAIENAGHEIFNECTEAKQQALDILGQWIENRGKLA